VISTIASEGVVPDHLKDLKADLRKQAAVLRQKAHGALAELAPLALIGHGFPAQPSKAINIVSGFFPYMSEIDSRPLLGRLAGEGWTTALPIVIAKGEPLVFRRWLPGEPTVTGVWDIPRPPDSSPLVEPDALLVPLMAFDRRGYRLGYGGGFYDRTLALLRSRKPIKAIGIAYAAQEVDSVPHDDHDQPMDFVMTEKEVFACG
jgi:5-formyltetrahydrofolate cyclo-ligase